MDKNKRNGHIAIFAANIFFGLNNPVSKSLMPDAVDPYALTFFRIGGGMVFFWLASIFVEKEKVPLKDKVGLFFAASLVLLINQLSFIVGLSKTSPIDASLVVTLLPILSMIFAAFILREPITMKKLVGVLIGASGALLLILSQKNVEGGSMKGNLIVLGAVISFALYLTVFKSLIARYKPITFMKWVFLFGTIQSYFFCQHSLMNTNFAQFDTFVVLRIVYIIVIATFISYILLAGGQKALRPTTLSMYNYLQPVVAAVVSVIVGLDTFGFDKVVSAILVFTGVYFVTQSKSKEQLNAERFSKKS